MSLLQQLSPAALHPAACCPLVLALGQGSLYQMNEGPVDGHLGLCA
jgi:hypothetical protein